MWIITERRILTKSERKPPEEQRNFYFAHILKTLINLINFNNSSKSHFVKVTLHDFTDLHVKMVFYEVKAHCWKGGGNGAQ